MNNLIRNQNVLFLIAIRSEMYIKLRLLGLLSKKHRQFINAYTIVERTKLSTDYMLKLPFIHNGESFHHREDGPSYQEPYWFVWKLNGSQYRKDGPFLIDAYSTVYSQLKPSEFLMPWKEQWVNGKFNFDGDARMIWNIGQKYLGSIRIAEKPSLFWKFQYRSYSKNRAIQFKPLNLTKNGKPDKDIHFSIIIGKKFLNVEQFTMIDIDICDLLKQHDNIIPFRIIKACKNSTYGRFDSWFEEVILAIRQKFSITCEKDLPLGFSHAKTPDERHQHIKDDELAFGANAWTVDNPIMFHINHSRITDETPNRQLKKFLSESPRNSHLLLDFN